MYVLIRHRLPELSLALLAAFFFFRELGTFPAAWADDSLFMIVAKEVAAGRGYVLPVLDHVWRYPHIVMVGPPIILPAALVIKLFGFSVAAARIPMVLYMIGVTILVYRLTWEIADKKSARWATLLLITLSAFVNTGKPVLDMVPAFFYLLLGFLCLLRADRRLLWAVFAGFFFGFAVFAKITFGLVYPALGIAWLGALVRRDMPSLKTLTIAGIIAVLIPLPWKYLELTSEPDFLTNVLFNFGMNEGKGFQILQGDSSLLLRMPYLTYGAMAVLGGIGLWTIRRKIPQSLWLMIVSLIILFTVYFLSSYGWYRHLLPAHLLLIPFVVIGMRSIVHKDIVVVGLSLLAIAQGLWQLDHRGSSRSTAAAEVAAYIEEHFQNQDLIVQQPEVFVRLPHAQKWRFLTNPTMTKRMPKKFVTLTEQERCIPLIRSFTPEEHPVYAAEGRMVDILGRYAMLLPPPDCP